MYAIILTLYDTYIIRRIMNNALQTLSSLTTSEKELAYKIYWNGTISRKDLQLNSTLKIANFYNTIDKLAEKGIISITNIEENKGKGRPPQNLTLNADFCNILCILITRSHFYFAVTDFSSNIIAQAKFNLSKNTTFAEFSFELSKFCINVRKKLKGDIMYCGLSSGHAIDDGVVIDGRDLHHSFLGININDELEKITSLPVLQDSIANTVSFGLYMKKYHLDIESFAFFNMSIGIGVGIINENKLLNIGKQNRPTVEHWIVNPMGRTCTCGQRGCAITSLGTINIVENIKSQIALGIASSLSDKFDILSFEDIVLASNNGDTLAMQCFEETANTLALTIYNFHCLFNSQKISIGGTLIRNNKVFAEFFNACLEKYQLTDIVNLEINFEKHAFEGITSEIIQSLFIHDYT